MPIEVADMLTRLGSDIRVARKRRRMSVKELADLVMVSSPTIQKLERGAPTVSLGVLATTLWVMGLAGHLGSIAAPETDAEGLRAEMSRLAGRRRNMRSNDF